MGEKYSSVKFRTVMIGTDIPDDSRLEKLKQWCQIFHKMGLAPPYPGGSYGNLSFRVRPGESAFIITATCMGLKGNLQNEQFVKVTRCELIQKVVYTAGCRQPSSETMMHDAIYRVRPDIHAVFHGHYPELLAAADRLNILQTAEEHPYGSPGLAAAVAACAVKSNFFVARNHGFVSIGSDMDPAGEQALKELKRAGAQD